MDRIRIQMGVAQQAHTKSADLYRPRPRIRDLHAHMAVRQADPGETEGAWYSGLLLVLGIRVLVVRANERPHLLRFAGVIRQASRTRHHSALWAKIDARVRGCDAAAKPV
jgi:hypothetical protein